MQTGRTQTRWPERFARIWRVVQFRRQPSALKTLWFVANEFRQRGGDKQMKTDEMRQRVSGQSKGDAVSIHAENQRPTGAEIDLAENHIEAEPCEQRPGKVLFADARTAGNQEKVES